LLKLKPDDLVKYLAENDLPNHKSLPKTVIETIKTLLKTKNLKFEVIEPMLNACNSHSGKLDLESQLLAANRACIEVKIWLELGSTENNRQYKYEFLLCCFELLEKSTRSIIDVETDESIPISDGDLDLMFKVSTKTNEMLIAVLEEMSQLGNSEEIYKYRKDEKYIDQSCKSVFDEWELDIMFHPLGKLIAHFYSIPMHVESALSTFPNFEKSLTISLPKYFLLKSCPSDWFLPLFCELSDGSLEDTSSEFSDLTKKLLENCSDSDLKSYLTEQLNFHMFHPAYQSWKED